MQDSYWSRFAGQRMGRRRALALSGGSAAAAAFLAACGSGSEGGDGDKSGLIIKAEDTFKQAERGGTLKRETPTDTPTFDFRTPISAGGGSTSCYSCLVAAIPGYLRPTESEIGPHMAESWEWSPDGLQITMKLRQGVKWHNKPPVNGRTMDMEDVLFSWKRFSDFASNRTNVVNAINPGAPVLSLTATDSRTIVIKLTEPVVYALELFAPYSGGGNMAMIPKETDSTFDIRTEVIGTGPLLMSDYKPSIGFYFKRHPEYYDKDWILVDQIDVPIIPEYAQVVAQLKSGNIHHTELIRGEDVLSIKREEPQLQIYATDTDFLSGTTATMNFGWLPEGRSPFLDERVRQAISMSWDRDLYLESVYNVANFAAEGLPIETRWNSHLGANWDGWWLDPKGKDFGANAKYFQYDLAEGKKLMAAAGYANGFDVQTHLSQPNQPQGSTAKFAIILDNMAAEVGMRAKVDYVDYNTQYIPLYRDGNGQYEGLSYPSLSGSGINTLTPIRALAAQYWPKGGVAFKGFSASGKNDQSGDPALSAMIEKARVEQDTEKRRALVFDIQRHLGKAIWGLCQPGGAQRFVMAWPAVRNYQVWRGGHWPSYRVWLDDTQAPLKPA